MALVSVKGGMCAGRKTLEKALLTCPLWLLVSSISRAGENIAEPGNVAEGATAPETLRQKDRKGKIKLWRAAFHGSPKGVNLSGSQTEGAQGISGYYDLGFAHFVV